MKAWQFSGTPYPLERVELPQPSAAPGEVVIRTRACGICHTDVAFFEDEKYTEVMQLPVVLGHEIAGEVVEVAGDVTSYVVGDRVVVWSLGEYHGGVRDGGFGEFVASKAETLVPIPDGVPYEHAAFAEPGMTAHAAVMIKGEVEAGTRVGIVGFGGLGQIGTRLAVIAGAEVHVAEPNEGVWDRAREAGATSVVKDVLDLAGLDLDVVIDFAGYGTTTAGAISVVRERGRVVQVGWGVPDATIDVHDLVLREVQLLGSHGAGKESMAAILAAISAGDITPTVDRITFDDIPDGIKRLQAGQVDGRLVALY